MGRAETERDANTFSLRADMQEIMDLEHEVFNKRHNLLGNIEVLAAKGSSRREMSLQDKVVYAVILMLTNSGQKSAIPIQIRAHCGQMHLQLINREHLYEEVEVLTSLAALKARSMVRLNSDLTWELS